MVGYRVIALALVLFWFTPAAAQDGLPEDPTEPFITVSLKPGNPYVQEQVRYTIRLYRHSHLQRGYFLDQNPPGMVSELLRDEQPRVVKLAGREYELIEREYLLFPQRSGDLTIPAPVFSSRDLFVKGSEPTLHVKSRPGNSGDWHWLPAKKLLLEQKLDLPQGEISPGMQLERTITIHATGLTGAQLPVLETPTIEGMEIQNLGSEVEQKIVNGIMLGKRHIRQLLIPKRTGEFVIPEISLSWWNTLNGNKETASLAKTSLQVNAKPETALAQKTGQESTTVSDSVPRDDQLLIDAQEGTNLKLLAIIVSLIVYGILIWHYRIPSILKLGWLIYRQKRLFKKACHSNDPGKASESLLAWGRLLWDKKAPTSILGFKHQFEEPESITCLRELDRANYSQDNQWSGTSALRLIPPQMKQFRTTVPGSSRGQLPPLYH